MSWIFISFISYFLFAIVIALDKLILARRLPSPLVYAFYTGIIEVFAVVLLPFGFDWPGIRPALLALFSGAVYIVSLVFLFRAILRFEASKAAPLVGAMVPLMLFIFSLSKSEFALSYFQVGAMVLLIIGGLVLSYQKTKKGEFLSLWWLVLGAAFFYGLAYFTTKLVYLEADFITGFVLGRFGGFLAAASFLIMPSIRRQIFSATQLSGRQSLFLVAATKSVAALAFILLHYATFLGNATLVQALNSLQYVFLIIILAVLSWKFPYIFGEDIRFKSLARKAVAIVLMLVGSFILVFSEKPVALVTGVKMFGATFSQKYAEDMKLDWREAYLAVLDDLKVKRLRLPAYWDIVESREGEFNFADLDWQLKEAENREVRVVLSVGYRLPRWPECHIPKWAAEKSRAEFEAEALEYLKTTIERYRDSRAILYWQIENEPFLRGFGECPAFSSEFLDKEIALARSLDSRPIVVSDSGELSLWFQAAERADVFGTTMYRTIWNEYIGYFNYPLPPEFFHFKANIVRSFGTMRKAIVIELQAEPWGSKMAYDLSPKEEQKSFSPQKFRDNIEYVRVVGFPEVYLWGAEWWFYKKQKGDSRYWEIAKEVFAQ